MCLSSVIHQLLLLLRHKCCFLIKSNCYHLLHVPNFLILPSRDKFNRDKDEFVFIASQISIAPLALMLLSNHTHCFSVYSPIIPLSAIHSSGSILLVLYYSSKLHLSRMLLRHLCHCLIIHSFILNLCHSFISLFFLFCFVITTQVQ